MESSSRAVISAPASNANTCSVTLSPSITTREVKVPVHLSKMQKGKTTPVSVTIYENTAAQKIDSAKDHYIDAIALPGITQNNEIYGPGAKCALSLNPNIRSIAAISFPGQGQSKPLPKPMKLGDITLRHKVETFEAVLQHLRANAQNEKTDYEIAIGHSTGTEVILLAQTLLENNKTSLRDLGVQNILFLAPVIPEPVRWRYPEGALRSRALQLARQFARYNKEHGLHLGGEAEAARHVMFSDRKGRLIPNPPSLEEVNRFNDPESARVVIKLTGFGMNIGRPLVKHFALEGLELRSVAFSQDRFMQEREIKQLQRYVSGTKEGFTQIQSPVAVHSCLYSSPQLCFAEPLTMSVKDYLNPEPLNQPSLFESLVNTLLF